MATNLATILVGLGYDLSALEKGAPEAYRLINSQTASMSAEMKRTSREGAESLRLIDEALGIHLSRPLTRILTQEFPGLAKGLQSVLGAGVVGALGVAGVELFDKVAKSIEKAQKAQEVLREATANVDKVFAEEMGAYKDKDKAVTAATAAVDKLAEAEMKEAKAAQEARGAFTSIEATVGDFLHKVTSFQSTLDVEKLNKGFANFLANYNTKAFTDSIDKTSTAVKYLGDEIKTVTAASAELDRQAKEGHSVFAPGQGIAEQAAAVKDLLTNLQRMKEVQDATFKGVANKDAEEALKKEVAAIQAADAATQKWAESLKKAFVSAQPPKDQYSALDAEIKKSIISLTNLQHSIGPISFRLLFDGKSLGEVEREMAQFFGSKITAPEIKLPSPALPSALPGATAVPTLSAGGTAAAQFAAFQADQAAQVRLSAQAFADIMTPAQKYQLTMKELDLVLKDSNGEFRAGVQGQAAYAAAAQKAREELEREERQIVKARDGLRSWLQSLKDNTNVGQFTFDMLNKGLQGFEDETVKALTGAKTNWASFFQQLDQMALKFMLNKMISSLLNPLSGTFGGIFGGGAGGAGAAAAGDWGSVSGVLADAGIAGFASGTDSAPGGMAWVGEQGPELLNLPAGTSVTPMGSLRSGINLGGIHIDAKGAEIGVEEKIARALSAALPQMVMRAVVESSEVQRRTPH